MFSSFVAHAIWYTTIIVVSRQAGPGALHKNNTEIFVEGKKRKRKNNKCVWELCMLC